MQKVRIRPVLLYMDLVNKVPHSEHRVATIRTNTHTVRGWTKANKNAANLSYGFQFIFLYSTLASLL